MIAQNQFAASVLATIRLRWKGAIAKEQFEIKPKLYVLAVGVSAYQDEALRLDLAAKDALDFGAAWNAQKGGLYSGVELRVLTDAQATKGDILDGLEWLQRQVTAKDVAVLFFAGHGQAVRPGEQRVGQWCLHQRRGGRLTGESRMHLNRTYHAQYAGSLCVRAGQGADPGSTDPYDSQTAQCAGLPGGHAALIQKSPAVLPGVHRSGLRMANKKGRTRGQIFTADAR